jgi:hypothetical protein
MKNTVLLIVVVQSAVLWDETPSELPRHGLCGGQQRIFGFEL